MARFTFRCYGKRLSLVRVRARSMLDPYGSSYLAVVNHVATDIFG